MRKLLCLILISLVQFSCTESMDQVEWEAEFPINPTSKGNRVLGISPSQSDRSFEAIFSDMQNVGVERVELNLEWSYFEKKVGEYQDSLGLLDAVAFYGANNIDIGLSIATINTVKRTDPEELIMLAFDDISRIKAFNNLIDWIISKINNRVQIAYISIGNEVDFVLKGQEWSAFNNFLNSSKIHIQKSNPDIKVGVKMTIGSGILGDNKEEVLELIDRSDIALLNYYPQNDQFQVYNIEQVEKELDLVRSLIAKPIYFTEIGYQSGEDYCNSSQEKQAQFYHFLFYYWDKYPTEISYININWMDEITQAELDFFENYYGFSDPAFLEYLGTLGLNTTSGSPKYAWKQILTDTEARNWQK